LNTLLIFDGKPISSLGLLNVSIFCGFLVVENNGAFIFCCVLLRARVLTEVHLFVYIKRITHLHKLNDQPVRSVSSFTRESSYVGRAGRDLASFGFSSITRFFQDPLDSQATESAAPPRLPMVIPAQMPAAPILKT
jgi:hypothetical protein